MSSVLIVEINGVPLETYPNKRKFTIQAWSLRHKVEYISWSPAPVLAGTLSQNSFRHLLLKVYFFPLYLSRNPKLLQMHLTETIPL